MGIDLDKMDITEEQLARLDPKTRKRVLLASQIESNKIEVPSIGMNIALEGGLGRGRQTLIYGNKSATKSSWAQQLVALNQKKGLTAGWIDAEQAWDRDWATKLGVDNTLLPVTRSKTVTEATEDIISFMEAGTDIIVVDSISALLPSSFFSDKGELKGVDKSQKIGAQALELGIMAGMCNYTNKETALILISQQRNEFHTTYTRLIAHGGKAVPFQSSTIIRFTSSEANSQQLTKKRTVGDKIFEDYIGRSVTWDVEKNKMAPQSRIGKYDFYYFGDKVGIDETGEVLDYAEYHGIVQRGGAWYNVYDEKFQGRDRVLEYLSENPEVLEKMRGELNNVI